MIFKVIMIIIVLIAFSYMLFNSKMNVFPILLNQFMVLKNYRNNKISIKDIFCFYLIPLFISVILVLVFNFNIDKSIISNLITIYSIVFSLLIGIITLLIPKKESSCINNQIKDETVVTCLNNVIVCVLTLISLLFLSVTQECKNLAFNTVNIVTLFLIMISINFMMLILKRFFILMKDDKNGKGGI